jgi:hypothetical protein
MNRPEFANAVAISTSAGPLQNKVARHQRGLGVSSARQGDALGAVRGVVGSNRASARADLGGSECYCELALLPTARVAPHVLGLMAKSPLAALRHARPARARQN